MSPQLNIIERVHRGDLTGLNFAGLVRLSFELDHGKKERPVILTSGADINGREDQDQRCRLSVEQRGGMYVYTYDEPDTSAWKRRRVKRPDGGTDWRVIRPVYEGALEDLKRGVAPNGERLDGLMIYDLDRLTRDNRHLEDAIDVVQHYGRVITDINLILDLTTDIGRSNARFLVTAKAMQSSDTARRVRDRHESIAVAGIPVGGSRPFGWNDDKRMLHPIESELIRKAVKDIMAGIGLHTICREWNKAAITTPRGHTWVRTVLRNLLLSPRLAGYRVYRDDICRDHQGKPVMGQYEPILTVQEWEDLKAYLTDRSKHNGSTHTGGRKYLLSGIVRCGLCGHLMHGYYDRRLDEFYYGCPSPTMARGCCGHVSINGKKLDAMVIERVLGILADTEVPATPASPWPRADELAAKETKIKELMTAYGSGELPKEHVFPVVAQLDNEAKALRRERSAWNREQQRASKATASVLKLWPDMDTDRKRAVIDTVIETVAINRRTIKQARFDPNRVDIVPREVSMASLQPTLRVLLQATKKSVALVA